MMPTLLTLLVCPMVYPFRHVLLLNTADLFLPMWRIAFVTERTGPPSTQMTLRRLGPRQKEGAETRLSVPRTRSESRRVPVVQFTGSLQSRLSQQTVTTAGRV
jgi:hypothetical protein